MREQGRTMHAIGKGQQEGPTSFFNPFPSPPTPSTPPVLHAVDTYFSAPRFRAAAGDVRMSILLLTGCWISVVGSCAAQMVLFILDPDQNVVPMPICQGLLPYSHSSPTHQ